MTPHELDAALIAAHGSRDADQIASLFALAGERASAKGEMDAACFFWTQGYIWALEAGNPIAAQLHRALKDQGRES